MPRNIERHTAGSRTVLRRFRHFSVRDVELRIFAALPLLWVALAAQSLAQFKTLYTFNGTANGAGPNTLAQGLDGNFYGTTSRDGPNSGGTVFRLTPAGTLTTLYSFCSQINCADGSQPGPLALATNGDFYGITETGGSTSGNMCGGGCGTLFKITSQGTLTTLYKFCAQTNCTDGSAPQGELVQGTDGNFYGATGLGGTSSECFGGCGTLFRITAQGVLKTLYNFCTLTNCTDGRIVPALVQAVDGNFYGVTGTGGNATSYCSGCGTIFKMTSGGALTTLYGFCSQTNCSDGWSPVGLIQGSDGNFYGTTSNGGNSNSICSPTQSSAEGCGTVFEFTPGGTLTTLYKFCAQTNCTDGYLPEGGVIQTTGGSFYGTTFKGGTGTACGLTCGTFFSLTATGTLTTLHDFNGVQPFGGVIQATDGNVYGTTANPSLTDGTVYSWRTGLAPFVETLPTFGKVGVSIKILGTNLTGASQVSFGGTASTFRVISASEIIATVPSGATTGGVTVTAPSAVLNSSRTFQVLPQIKSFSPSSGAIGTNVTITGVSLMQASEVTFGGVAASFTVNSDTQVTASVPAGAKTGRIAITTPGGIAYSATNFTVTP